MKNLAKFALLGFVAWLFVGCSATITADTQLTTIYDTQPRGAVIYCGGKEMGLSPYIHTTKFDNKTLQKIKANKGKYTQMDCKAVWASGYSANFNRQGDLKDFDKDMQKTEKLIRGKDGDLNLDILAEKRAEKIRDVYDSDNEIKMWLGVYGVYATIYCNSNLGNYENDRILTYTKIIDTLKVLKSGILEVRQCKAEFEGGITKYFKNKINLDKDDISTLTHQNLYLTEQERMKFAALKAQEEARLALLAEQEKRQECLNGDFAKCNGYKDIENLCMKRRANACVHLLDNYDLKCPSYLKVAKKACDLKIGDACVLLGDEYHPISHYDSYKGKWTRNYGKNCSLANERQAYSLYKKACDLGASAGCDRHNELDMIIMEIGERKDDKIRKYDYTIKYR